MLESAGVIKYTILNISYMILSVLGIQSHLCNIYEYIYDCDPYYSNKNHHRYYHLQNEYIYIYGRNVKISASFLKYTFLKCASEQVFPHKQ